MTSHPPESGVQTEGTPLPAPRPFVDANTLTLPRRRRQAPGHGSVVRWGPVPEGDGAVLHAEIMRVEATPLTVTF